jgi:tetratricopeptide (TPR) repeat protein
LRNAVAARKEAEAARDKEERMRREVESRETVRKAGLLMAQSQFEQADELLGHTPIQKPSLESQALLRTLGDWNAINGQWPRAIERFSLLVKLEPADDLGVTLDQLRLGAALVESGKRGDYERFRQEVVSHFGGTTNPLPDRIIKSCLLLPANRQILERLEAPAETAEKELVGGLVSREPWTSSALALLEYRRGNDLKAMNLSARCLNSRGQNGPPGALAQAVLALAYRRLHQYKEGLAALSQAQERIDLAFKKGLNLNPNNDYENWFDWVLARIVLREGQE